MVYPNGDIYKGTFKNGERCGTGVCQFPRNGALFRGEWRDDKPFGNGILFSIPGEIIEARFDGYKIVDGQVKILFQNGEFYEGNLKNNVRSSTGNHYYKNGDVYEGERQNDCRVGNGRLIFLGGSKLQARFIDD